MEDLTGLGKIATSKIAEKAYSDALSPAASQVGKLGEQSIKVVRLLTLPIQLLASVQDRVDRWLTEVHDAVPPERQIEARPEIAGPILENMRYLEESNPLARMYVNLLKRAIDRDRRREAHPAFIKILEQLSPEEISIVEKLRTAEIRTIVEVDNSVMVQTLWADYLPDNLSFQELQPYFDHLISLELIQHEPDRQTSPIDIMRFQKQNELNCVAIGVLLRLGQFGKTFVKACCDPFA